MRYRQGMTMVELLLVLAIAAILVSFGAPALHNAHTRYQARSGFQALLHMVRFARQSAVVKRQYVTVCPTLDRLSCSDDWSRPVMVFVDMNKNEHIDAGDNLLAYQEFRLSRGWFKLSASARRQYLQFKPSGVSNGVAGNIRLCGAEPSLSAFKLVVSLSGRISLIEEKSGHISQKSPC